MTRRGFLSHHFGTDDEIVESSTGRAYVIRRRRGMPFIGGVGLILMGCLMLFVFAPNSGDSTFKTIGIVMIVIGAISCSLFSAWLAYQMKQQQQNNDDVPIANANPIYADAQYA